LPIAAKAAVVCPGHDVKLPKQNQSIRNEKMIKLLLEKIKKNHALAMILCCGIPIVGILALSSLGLLGSWGYYALILLCPLGHIFMMRGMMHSNSKENMVPRQIEYKNDES
jgi:hypothetical protein